jgi:hypothetical protein
VTAPLLSADLRTDDTPEGRALFERRMQYLAVLQGVEPDVLKTLESDVFPLYMEGAEKATACAIETWSERFRLDDPWIIQAAYATLYEWGRWFPDDRPHLWGPRMDDLRAHIMENGETPSPSQFDFHGHWHPHREQRGEARERLLCEFLKELSEFLDACERHHAYERHLRWCALFQTKRKAQRDIRSEEPGDLSRQAVQKGIRSAASGIGLSLRDGRKGPRKFDYRHRGSRSA